jgi:hypothetical protein
MKYLKDKISQFNERIKNNAMILKEIEQDELNRKFDSLSGDDSGIEGSDENLTFKY